MMPKVLPLSSGPLSVSVLPVRARLLYPGRVGSPHAWLPLAVVLGSSRAEWGQLVPLHAWAPLSRPACLGKHPRPWQPGTYAPHSTFSERMLSKPHSMMFGQAEVNSILLPWKFSWSYTVIWNGERAAQLETAQQRPQAIQRLVETEGGSVGERASTGHPSGLGHSPARLRVPALLAPAPLSCSPLRRSVPGAAVPSGERSGAVLGRAGGRAVAGGSPGLCSERSRAKRINGGKGEGHLPGGLRLTELSSPGQLQASTGCSSLVHVFVLSLSAPSLTCGYCQTPRGCSLPRSTVATAYAHPVCTDRGGQTTAAGFCGLCNCLSQDGW